MNETAQATAQVDPADFISLWEFFSELFVPENNLALPLKEEHKIACDTLQMAVEGTLTPYIDEQGIAHAIKYVVLNLPPRVGKTKICEALICWLYAYFPDAQNIYTCYAANLAEASIRYICETLQKPWFVSLYGDRVHGRKSDHVTTTQGGNLYAEGTGGSLTGKGAGLKRPAGGVLVIDDAAKPDEALSPVEAANVRLWFENTAKDRRNSTEHTPIVICAQRLAPLDLTGYVLKHYKDQTFLVKFPALVNGESRFPETITTEDLLTYQRTRIGRFVLASKYQQEPTALGGNLIPTDTFDRYDPSTARSIRWEKLVIPIDTALKVKQANDYSCAGLYGLYQKRVWLIDLIHGKWESPDLVANVTAFWEKWSSVEGQPRPRMVIEEKAAGTPLLQTLARARVPATGIERDIDKVRRVQSILPFIETHCVVIPKEGSTPWIDAFVTECAEFAADGTHAHDDQVDTLVDGVEFLLGKGMSILDVLKSAPQQGPRFVHPQPQATRA